MRLSLEDHELGERHADQWWLFMLTGLMWLVVALLVFRWSYTTVYAVSFLFGVVALIAGVNELAEIAVSTPGWKVVRGILGLLFVVAGIWALFRPHNAFTTLAALIGFFLLCKGVFDLLVVFIAKEEFDVWWFQLLMGIIEILLAFWVAGSFEKKVILLVVYVGIIALTRGISEIILALKLKRLPPQPPLATA
jgi:uncharacterized membrane protein HdeD (DUF308 family)